MDRHKTASYRQSCARDRKRFLVPALAAAVFNPLPWLLPVGVSMNGPFLGFGGWAVLDELGVMLLVGGVPACLGWAFASRAVFSLLAWGGVICWLGWASFLALGYQTLTVAWPGLSTADRAIALLLAAQLLGYPVAFWLALRSGMGWDRSGSPRTRLPN